jgi:hypothetical protein
LKSALAKSGEQNLQQLAITAIRMDGGTQPRAAIDPEVVSAYAEAMQSGAAFPPVEVFFDGTDYWLGDGFHRVNGGITAGLATILCNIRPGTLEDAQWFSYSANQTNGLYRKNEDKQRAVEAALRHPKSAGLSDEQIGKHIGCSGEWVRRIRHRLTSSNQLEDRQQHTATRNGTTYQMNTANIGRSAYREKRDLAIAVMKENPNLSNIEISEQFGVDNSTVADWRKLSGTECPPSKPRLMPAKNGEPTNNRHAIRLRAEYQRLMVGLNQIVGASSTIATLGLSAVASILTDEDRAQIGQFIRRAQKDLRFIASELEKHDGGTSKADYIPRECSDAAGSENAAS